MINKAEPCDPPRPALFRPWLQALAPAWLLAASIFGIHALVRFGGLWDARLYALSMVIVWPLPWLLSPREGRRRMGLRAPAPWHWFWIGPLAAIGALLLCAGVAWAAFGRGEANWFVQHAVALHEVGGRVPPGVPASTLFWIATVPAMIFSPLAEEFLYRGFLLAGLAERWGRASATILQAAAFALVHLSHYGLRPVQPLLLTVWLPSMFLVALGFGWLVHRAGSLWPAVVAHSVLNLGMNGIVFWLLPDLIGI